MQSKKLRKIYKLSTVSIAMYGCIFCFGNANASSCDSAGYGTIVINNTNNTSGCSVSSVESTIGGPYYDVGFYVYSQYTD